MSSIVLDGSLAVAWFLQDEANENVLKVREDLRASEHVWVASHWAFEVANAFLVAERRKRIAQAEVTRALSVLRQMAITTDHTSEWRASAETIALARQHMLSVYDAAYLELALRHGAALASVDAALRLVAHKLNVKVLPAFSSF